MSSDIRRPKQFEEMLRKLCQEDNKIFLTYKDALVFAACLGFHREKRQPFDRSSEPVSSHIFRGDYDAAIFNCIGLAVTKDPHIMGTEQESERVRIFEEYACGGLEIIEDEIYKGAGNWDQLLLSMVASQAKPESSILDDITQAFG
jgi:dnd system-associated protein 4